MHVERILQLIIVTVIFLIYLSSISIIPSGEPCAAVGERKPDEACDGAAVWEEALDHITTQVTNLGYKENKNQRIKEKDEPSFDV